MLQKGGCLCAINRKMTGYRRYCEKCEGVFKGNSCY